MKLNSFFLFFVFFYMILNSSILSILFSLIFTCLFHKDKYITLILAYYILISWIEWFAHKYYMHDIPETNRDHLRHHRAVLPNMNLIKKDEYGDNDFNWGVIFQLTLIGFILSYYYFFVIYELKPITHFVTLLGGATLVSMIWNNVHNAMHCEDLNTTIWRGPPSVISQETARSLPGFYTLYKHHYLHHIVKRPKGNFNIVFLGMDRIMGTQVDEKDIKIKINECKKK